MDYILLTPTASPRRVSRRQFRRRAPALHRADHDVWLRAMRQARKVERSMDLLRHVAEVREARR